MVFVHDNVEKVLNEGYSKSCSMLACMIYDYTKIRTCANST